MYSAWLTPYVRAAARSMGRDLWEKKVLPVGEVQYQGRVLRFTRDYLDGLAQTFKAGAYPQVPFQLAPGDNSHTNDPERFRGDIVGMDVRDDGLYVTLATTSKGSEVISDNPMLGVSARIVEDYERSDGQFYPAAVQHVLGTLDPRIPSVSGGWKQFELANAPATIIDLTGAEFSGQEGGGTMPDLSAEQQAKLARLLEIPDDKLELWLASLDAAELTDEDLAALTGGEGEGEYDVELTDAELAELVATAAEMDAAGLLGTGQPQLAGAGAPAGTALSAEAQMAIELTNGRADELERQLGVVNAHLAEEQFRAEQRRFAMDLGIAPYITELARPVLEGGGHIIEMANGQGVDAGQVMRRVLTEIGKAGKMLDLSFEAGSSFDEPEGTSQAASTRDEIVGRFKAQTGIR